MDRKIAVVGLGYVGLPVAAAFGRHHPVVGFDINSARIDELKRGHDRTGELTADDLAHDRKKLGTDVVPIDPFVEARESRHECCVEFASPDREPPLVALIVAEAHSNCPELIEAQLQSQVKTVHTEVTGVNSFHSGVPMADARLGVFRVCAALSSLQLPTRLYGHRHAQATPPTCD